MAFLTKNDDSISLLSKYIFFFNYLFFYLFFFSHNGKTVFMNTERGACLKIIQKMYGCYLKNQSWLP
jgi:hypothetical protein